MATIRRDWLMKQVDAGKIEARCGLYIEHDGDGQSDHYGKAADPWLPARIRRPKFEPRMMPGGFERDVCTDHGTLGGYMNLSEHDFASGSGRVYATSKAGPFSLHVHSNLSYELRFKTDTK